MYENTMSKMFKNLKKLCNVIFKLFVNKIHISWRGSLWHKNGNRTLNLSSNVLY